MHCVSSLSLSLRTIFEMYPKGETFNYPSQEYQIEEMTMKGLILTVVVITIPTSEKTWGWVWVTQLWKQTNTEIETENKHTSISLFLVNCLWIYFSIDLFEVTRTRKGETIMLLLRPKRKRDLLESQEKLSLDNVCFETTTRHYTSLKKRVTECVYRLWVKSNSRVHICKLETFFWKILKLHQRHNFHWE